MAWVRLDDGFPEHIKVMRGGPLAELLYVRALCFANKNLTDGVVPAFWVARQFGLDGPAEAARLVEAGLWEPHPDGWMIHDYLRYQPSSEKVKGEREANARRQADWRASHAGRNDVSNGVGDDVTPDPTQYPYPVPVIPDNPEPGSGVSPVPACDDEPAPPDDTHTDPPEQKSRKQTDRPIPPGWRPAGWVVEWARGEGFDDRRIAHEAEAFRAQALAKDRRLVKWDQGFKNWLLSPYCPPPDAPPRASPNGRASPPKPGARDWTAATVEAEVHNERQRQRQAGTAT